MTEKLDGEPKRPGRSDRLAAALRANLARRKAQARARDRSRCGAGPDRERAEDDRERE